MFSVVLVLRNLACVVGMVFVFTYFASEREKNDAAQWF